MATVKKIKKAQEGLTGLKKRNLTSFSGKTPTAPPPTMYEKLNREDRDRIAAKIKEEMKPKLMPSLSPKTDSLGRPAMKNGGKTMMKRADGSTSQRGLWDNIRAAAKKNKAAGKPGKKPTSAMLKQEKKIKSQTKNK